jgi:hypothetical protein
MGELAEGVRDNPLVFPPAPEDRRLYVSVRRAVVVLVCGLGLVPVVCAWVWYLAAGLPELRPLTPAGPEGFPGWLRLAHFANLMLMVFLVRSGFCILMDHPRLYWNDHCTPGSDWARFTPLAMPRDREWTAKQDSRFRTPWLGLPGYRHTVGIARHWHFLAAFFWTNGKVPTCPEWKALGPLRRDGYRLRVSGLVARPTEFSIADLQRLGKREQITLHHCIQGWTGVAQWGGVTVRQLMDAVQPLPDARVVVFRSFGEGHYGGEYYDTLTIDDAGDPQTLLAWEMNDGPLPDRHGAPLRLRVENQLGYKMVKWIKSMEFVGSEAALGKGYGGKNEDDEYYPVVADM